MTESPVPTLVLPTARRGTAQQAQDAQQLALQLDIPGEDINALTDCILRGDEAGARVVGHNRLYLAVTDSGNAIVKPIELARIFLKLRDVPDIAPEEVYAWASPSLPAAELALLINEVFYGHPRLGAEYVPNSEAVVAAVDLRPALAERREREQAAAQS